MSSCEKCWADSGGNPDIYAELIIERKGNPCTLEEQAGIGGASWCNICKRFTVHQYTHKCLNIRSNEHLEEYKKQSLESHDKPESQPTSE